jgi:hypothetical protein
MYFGWFMIYFLEVDQDSLVALIVYTNNNLIGVWFTLAKIAVQNGIPQTGEFFK